MYDSEPRNEYRFHPANTMKKIAIIGAGNVGSSLAISWLQAGHSVLVGAQFPLSAKSLQLAAKIGEGFFTTILSAVHQSDIIVLATPASAAIEVAKSLGNTQGKIIIDTMNIVMGRGPVGYANTTDAILANTYSRDVVKCFNTTGFNNMQNPRYGEERIDMFVAGDSLKAKAVASELSLDVGFNECYDVGGNDKFTLMEQFAFFWINLAIFQGQGREIAFKLMKR